MLLVLPHQQIELFWSVDQIPSLDKQIGKRFDIIQFNISKIFILLVVRMSMSSFQTGNISTSKFYDNLCLQGDMYLNYLIIYYNHNFKLILFRMCGPIDKCCMCIPAKVGVNFIGGFLILIEIGVLIYTIVILEINNKVDCNFKTIILTPFIL